MSGNTPINIGVRVVDVTGETVEQWKKEKGKDQIQQTYIKPPPPSRHPPPVCYFVEMEKKTCLLTAPTHQHLAKTATRAKTQPIPVSGTAQEEDSEEE